MEPERNICVWWVMSYMRPHSQAAATALMFSSARQINMAQTSFRCNLLVTNETKFEGLKVSSRDSLFFNIDFWFQKIGLSLDKIHSVFQSIIIGEINFDGGRLLNYIERSADFKKCENVFIFNNSFPSPQFKKHLEVSGFVTIYMPMAPVPSLDFYNIIFSLDVREHIKINLNSGKFQLSPLKYVYELGRLEDLEANRPIPSNRSNIFTCLDNILERLTLKDWSDVIIPTLAEFPEVTWHMVGCAGAIQENSQRISEILTGIAPNLSALTFRIRLYPRMEDLFELLENECHVLYKGFNTGGATTVAGAIHRGCVVVDYDFADSRAFLSNELLAIDTSHARETLKELILNDDFYGDSRIRLRKALVASNSQAGNMITSAITHFFSFNGKA